MLRITALTATESRPHAAKMSLIRLFARTLANVSIATVPTVLVTQAARSTFTAVINNGLRMPERNEGERQASHALTRVKAKLAPTLLRRYVRISYFIYKY